MKLKSGQLSPLSAKLITGRVRMAREYISKEFLCCTDNVLSQSEVELRNAAKVKLVCMKQGMRRKAEAS